MTARLNQLPNELPPIDTSNSGSVQNKLSRICWQNVVLECIFFVPKTNSKVVHVHCRWGEWPISKYSKLRHIFRVNYMTIDWIDCVITCSIRSALSLVKFRVLTCERTFLIANYRRGVENSTKLPLLFKRISPRNASNFPSNFHAIFRWKFTKTKNEFRAFHLHYFCTVL